jgi:eukaryotic-like serine/threonine-protein kinase
MRFPELDGYPGAIAFTMILGLFGAAIGWWARDSLSRSKINRSLRDVVTATLASQLLLFAGGWLAGIPSHQIHVILILLWALSCALVTVTVERRFWPTTLGYVIGFFIQAYEPRLRFIVNGITNGILLVNTVVIWGQVEDVVEPMQRRAEERRKRWEAFLERNSRPD